MQTVNEPLQLEIMDVTGNLTRGLGRISVLDYFDPSTGEFHPEGLFSNESFGPVGSPDRQLRFGLIETRVTLFHPLIYKAIVALKRFYGDIIAGRRYAVWDEKNSEFVESDPFDGETGFSFFLRHWKDIKFSRTSSFRRDDNIALIEKYKDVALQNQIIVLPAGLRDMVVENGRPVSDEINDLYHRIVSIANTIPDSAVRANIEMYDNSRNQMNLTFIKVYEHIESLIQGKKGFFLGKYASRRIQDGTRNVISSLPFEMVELGDPLELTMNDTVVGMNQVMVAIRPVAIHRMLTGILETIFFSPDMPARLVDPDTLMQVDVDVSAKTFDNWTTSEGLNKVLGLFSNQELRHRPIMIEGHWLALLYRHNGVFKVFNDIRELPEGFSREHVQPISLAEFLYHALYPVANNHPAFVTRYPVSGVGSIYPSMMYMKSTAESERLYELDENWEKTADSGFAREFPIRGLVFHDTTSPHPAHIGAMGGDFDGDMVTLNALYMLESMVSIRKHFDLRRAYIGTNGKVKFSISTNPVELTLFNMTGE